MSDSATQSWGGAIFKFFRSVKLAIVLILIITITSIISTLIPQGRDPAFYSETYGKFINWVILSTGFNNFFRSFLFIVPSFLFFVNLTVCTYDRFIGRLKRGVKKRFGPDILHIGLLILIIGGIITFSGRKESLVWLDVGEKATLPDGYVLSLESFDFLKYENGRPKDWISTVKLERDGKVIRESFPIEVNNPLKAGSSKIYQSSYSANTLLYLTGPDGTVYSLDPGQLIPIGEEGLIFKDVIKDPSGSGDFIAVFDRWADHEVKEQVRKSKSDKIDIYTISGIDSQMSTGLQVVNDPGYFTVLMGLILLTIGLFMTYYQKLGDDKL